MEDQILKHLENWRAEYKQDRELLIRIDERVNLLPTVSDLDDKVDRAIANHKTNYCDRFHPNNDKVDKIDWMKIAKILGVFIATILASVGAVKATGL